MKRKCAISVIAVFALVCLALTACIVESERPVIRDPWIVNTPNFPNYGEPITGGPIRITATGHEGREIAVYLVLDATGRIIVVNFNLETETQSHVGPLPGTITPIILLTNSFNFPNTIVSGATVTAERLTNAVRREFIERGVLPNTVGFGNPALDPSRP